MMNVRWISAVMLLACNPGDRGSGPETPASAQGVPIDAGEPPVIEGDHNLIRNGTFADGTAAPWKATVMARAAGEASLAEGAYCLQLSAAGDTAWDAQLRHRGLALKKGHKYLLEFTAFADRDTKIRPKVGQIGPPYGEYWASIVPVATQPQRYRGHFAMSGADDPAAELTFAVGGPLVPEGGAVRVCIDDVALSDPQYEPPPPPDHVRAPKIRVNQVGYFPGRTKVAVYRSPEGGAWELVDGKGKVVAKGETKPFGEDAASGDSVQWIDFTAYKGEGEGYRLRIGTDESDAFSIGRGIYRSLKYDAIAFFYHNRSGIEIAMPYAKEERWARPAAHLDDKAVKCRAGMPCKGTFDVSGGWYDAGDHGKYVVNGGISVWTLLAFYERTLALGGNAKEWGDGKLAIPERDNGAPDLLDEVRWELEMLLRMQVPAGHPKWAGMAFHKVHEEKWSPIPLAPNDAKEPRFLHAPSTAATLNLAAIAAQAGRLYKKTDPAFAKKCLEAAKRAWAAAKKNPKVYAPDDDSIGGGPYGDKDVSDEFYWAAVELWLSTGDEKFRKEAKASKHFGVVPGPLPDQGAQMAPMNWQVVQALGTISLALAGEGADAKAARAAIIEVAGTHVASVEKLGYRVPLTPDAGGKYPWGSNSLVLNNAVLLALAYDFTKDTKYLDAVVDAFDYLLGRNPMWQSYVTGYGANPLQNPHHRFWAHQKDEKYPEPPPGIVSGGPNSGLEDPYAQGAGLPGCPPQRCFVDHIESWSTNEITINWNAPLFWAAAFLDERAGGER